MTEASTEQQVMRLAWIDNLRVVVICGVIVFHAATAYVVDIPWYYEERTTSVAVLTAFSMPLLPMALFGLGPLFVVAGWLTSASLTRHGGAYVVRSRLLRLGVPALVFLVLLDPLGDYLGGRAAGGRVDLARLLTEVGGTRDLGPMWFVVALLVFSLLYVGWRAVRPAPSVQSDVRARVLLLVAVAVAAVDFVTWLRWPYFGSTPWNVNFAHWPQAAGLFVLGVLAGERGWFARLRPRLVRRCGWVFLAALAVVLALAGAAVAGGDIAQMAGGWHAFAAALALLDGVAAVTLAVWVVGWFQAHGTAAPSALLARAGRASYPAYILHPLVLVGLSAAARALPVPPEVKFLVVAAIGVPASFIVGHFTTRVPGINQVV